MPVPVATDSKFRVYQRDSEQHVDFKWNPDEYSWDFFRDEETNLAFIRATGIYFNRRGNVYIKEDNNGNLAFRDRYNETEVTLSNLLALLGTLITIQAAADPGTPTANSGYLFLTASGTTPNRTIKLMTRLEDGTDVIIVSAIV